MNFQCYKYLFLALLIIGCRTPESRTEQARKNAAPLAIEYLLAAQEAFETGFYDQSLTLTDSAAAHAPELADIPFLRGRVLTALRRVDDATKTYENVLALDPAYPGVYMNLGNSAFMRGQPEQALDFYRLEKGVDDTPTFLIQLGRAYADTGKPDSARWALEKAIAADSSNATAYMWLGQILEDEGSFEEALKYSMKGRALQPDNANYAYVVGVQHLRNGDLEEAAELLKVVTGKLTTHYAAHYNLGQALLGLGQNEEAQRYLTRADSLLSMQKDIEKWERLVNDNNQEPMLWVNYGTALHKGGRIDEAIEAFSIAFSLQPQWLELQNNIANLLIMRGDTAEAMYRYMRLLEVDSTQADVWLNLGTIRAMTGDYGGAREAWETTLRHAPNHAEAKYYLTQLPE